MSGYIIGFIALLALSALFSAAESAYTECNRLRIESSAEEGEPVPEKDCAISVYVQRAGDGLWELAKRLNKSPEEVVESNPDLEFPIREGQRVVIYRKKAL